ncbi:MULTISPECIES: glycosyl hydrolase [Paenibacillus]|uniref:Beta-mannosidase n=1 Tax=Paenibacillus albilobatus TaxID=2716884 RepID=A0A919XL67_9BACL|nr:MULTISPECIES: glycosyl hydrolase [Paenibacillus]GIO33443.1 hypothetical protein J2TS6_45840 [Paenibacillus albilobatus]
MNASTKWLSTALSAVLFASLLSSPVNGTAASQTTGGSKAADDIAGHWAQASIQKWKGNALIQGYPDGTFHPNGEITRAEFVSLLNQLFGFAAQSKEAFADVPADAWFANAFSSAREAGYYKGYPGNEAKPNRPLTRQDAAVLLARAFELGASEAASPLPYSDREKIGAYAREAVRTLSGIFQGYPNGTFRPEGHISRAEVFTLIDKLVSTYYPAAGTFSAGKISGNAVVNHGDVVLKDAVIQGNLYLAPGIGDGRITLDHVTVQGTLFIEGGGQIVILKDSVLRTVLINRRDGQVQVQLSGTTRIGQLTANSASRLDAGDASTIDSAEFNRAVQLNLGAGASVTSLTVTPSAAGTAITGTGSIKQAVIQGTGVTLNGTALQPGTVTISAGTIGTGSVSSGTSGAGGSSSGSPGGSSSGGSGSGNGGGNEGGPVETVPTVNLVDAAATDRTRSLFVYLNQLRGKNILFGQQHATTEGLSITAKDGTQSDTFNSVGAYPGLFGWDTLSLEGKEKPGVAGNAEQSRDNLVAVMKKAYADGGVLTLSSHMPNFVTGGDFYDTKGNVVSHILPGGDKNAAYNAFLDRIADFALHLKTDDGKPIPVIFRPFHEQSGSWFWWGAAFTTADEYKEIYRYTVEYLRDKKGVHNFLYAYSPGGGFGDSADTYLKTYPGDDYVDVLGFDSYYNGEGDSWFNGVKTEAKTVSQIADSRGKVAAFTEFGYQKMKIKGNTTPDFYTKLAGTLQSDPVAKKMAYMQTWANFGPDSVYVPYPTGDPNQEHEMLPDFKKFYQDAYTLFSDGVTGAYDKKVNTASGRGFMHVASPTHQSTIKDASTVLRARVLNETPDRVVYSIQGSDAEYPMALNPDSGYYEAEWTPAASLNGKTVDFTVKIYGKNGAVLHQQTNTVFVKISEVLAGAYTFDAAADVEGIQYNGEYTDSLKETHDGSVAHSDFNGGSLKISAPHLNGTDSWQELKLELKNAKTKAGASSLADIKRVKMDVWVPVSAGETSANASLRAVGQLPPDWSNKYGMDTTYVPLASLPKETIDGVEYVKFSPTIDFTNTDALAAADDIALSIVGSGLNSGGEALPVYVDNIRLYNAYNETSGDPAMVDDFEGYLGSSDALAGKFVHAGGDPASAALDGVHKHGGSYGLKYTYTLAGSGYAGITKAMNGADWSGYNALQFWYQPDGQGQKLVMQINVGGKTYEYYPDTKTTEPALITAPFHEFKPANGATGTLTKTNLKNVQAFSIYTNAVPDGHRLTSSMYFDDIHALLDPNAGTVPSGSESGGIAPGVLFDFNDSIAGWTLNDNTLGADNLANPEDGGSKVLSADFPATAAGDQHFELAYMSDQDLSQGGTLKVRARVAGGAAKAKLFIKTGANWAWASTDEVELTGEYQWITLSLNGKDIQGEAIDKTLIKAIGLQISSPNGQGKMTVYVDDVTLDEKELDAGASDTLRLEEKTTGDRATDEPDDAADQEKTLGEGSGQ